MEYTTTVIESQADWLTMAVHNQTKTLQLRNLAEGIEIDELQAKHRAIPFRSGGYVGFRTGRIAYGERENAAIVQLSGDLARSQWDRFYPLSDSITRLDLAVTVRYPDACDGRPEAYYRQALDFYREHPNSARPELHVDGDNGGTCMVGKRGSDFHLRFYDKNAECLSRNDIEGAERYRNCMRAELEMTDLAAVRTACFYNGVADREAFTQAFLYNYLTSHGIACPFPQQARKRPLADSAGGQTMRHVGSGLHAALSRRLTG